MKIVFVAGTGTDVGKTYIAKSLAATLVANGVRVGVYKPVASGCSEHRGCDDAVNSNSTLAGDTWVASDAEQLWRAAGEPLDLDHVCPQRFRAAVAPDEAARREGKTVDVDLLIRGAEAWREHCDILIVEGAGGLLSPLADNFLNLDLFQKFENAQLVLVAANRLGVIHDVIATSRAAELAGVSVTRSYLSAIDSTGDASSATNANQIRKWCPGLEVRTVAWNGSV